MKSDTMKSDTMKNEYPKFFANVERRDEKSLVVLFYFFNLTNFKSGLDNFFKFCHNIRE